jgi:branched-chain amino acid transport system substrate-binding protein
MPILTSCSDLQKPAEKRSHRADNAGRDDPILIGAAAPWEILSGLGHYRKGLEMALEEINQKKVLGRRIELLWRDDQGSVSQGRAVAQQLAENPDVMAVIGHYQSSITIPVSLIYQHYGLLMVSATATATKVTSRDGMNLVFRNIPDDRQVASQLADFSLSQGYKRIIVVNEDNEFGSSLANAFENRAGHIGLNVVDRRSYDFTTGDSHFKKMIQTWQDFYQFDAVFLAGVVPKAAEFIALARDMGVRVPIIGGDGLDSPQLWEIGGDRVDGVIVGTYFHPEQAGRKVSEFVTAFNKKYGVMPDAWAALSYDSLHLLAQAMRKAETCNPPLVAETLHTMEAFEGVTGQTRFDEQGNVVGRSIVTKVVRNRQFHYLEVK